MFHPRISLACLALIVVPASSGAQASATHLQTPHGSIAGDSLVWVPGDVAGRARAYLLGDPAKHGMFAARFQYPKGFLIPPHWHTATVHATVLAGKIHVGMGDVTDSTKTVAYGPGSFIIFEGGMNHFEYFSEATVLHVEGVGPFRTVYVKPPSSKP